MLHLMTPSHETMPLPRDEARWDAVQRRDCAADGTFVYSVRTTGVYCRPSCAARMPRRENVAFHQTCADAERAGFRPCKRCRPNEPARADRRAAAVATACRLIEEAEEVPSLDVLAQAAFAVGHDGTQSLRNVGVCAGGFLVDGDDIEHDLELPPLQIGDHPQARRRVGVGACVQVQVVDV